jgi:hypothetical protein
LNTGTVFEIRSNHLSRLIAISILFLLIVSIPAASQCVPAPPLGVVCPSLAGASPATLIAGVRQQRLTITGSGFVPGAFVLISLPNSDPPQPAPDIAIVSTTFISSNLIVVTVDVNRLSSGLRMVDVINPPVVIGATTYVPNSEDNPPYTPTTRTTQQIFITGSDSLAGPLQVQNLLVTYPREGTIIHVGDDVYGEAVLAGAGTGMVTGVWLWDGNVVEQFADNLIGGESTTIRTSNPLPATFTGPHTLQLQITSPQTMTSRLVQVVVNGGDWQVLRLLLPRLGAVYAGASGPGLRWTPVPGAAKYEVGFASRPFFDDVIEWHEVTDNVWNIPRNVWTKLPEGELFWTVRVVDMSGAVRRPAPMRSLWHVPAGALRASSGSPHLSARGSVILEWNGLKMKSYYMLTISSDEEGANVLRRYLTGSPVADLYALQGTLQPGRTYYWKVQALSPQHHNILEGPRQSFEVPAIHARAARPQARLQLASLRTLEPLSGSIAKISRRNPGPGETIDSGQPKCEIMFSDAVDTNSLALSVDGVDVTALAELASSGVKYNPVFPLENGEHTVQLDLKPDSEDWKFSVAAKAEPQPPASAAAATNTDAEVASKAEGPARPADEVGPEFKTHFGFDPQLGSSPTPNQITLTGGEQTTFQRGNWKVDFNGSGIFQALITPQPDRVFGRVQDYVGQIDYTPSHFDFGTRFGLLAPSMYTDAQFITTAIPRQAVEPKIATPAGTFRYYANTNDVNAGGGDTSSYHQWIRGAGYEAPLPSKWATFRVMWMNARDIGPLLGTASTATTQQTVTLVSDPANPKTQTLNAAATLPPMASGDIYGGLLKVHLPINVELFSEYAVSRNNPDRSFDPKIDPYTASTANVAVACPFSPQVLTGFTGYVPVDCGAVSGTMRLFGRAWRAGMNGSWKKTKVSIAYRDVTRDFSNPANPSITPMGNPNRRGLDSSISQGTFLGDFDFGYQYLQSDQTILNLPPANPPQPDLPALQLPKEPSTTMKKLSWGWRRRLKTGSQFMIRGHEALVSSGKLPSTFTGIDRNTLASQGLYSDQRDVGFNSSFLQTIKQFNFSATISRDWFRNSALLGQNAIMTGTQFGVSSRRVAFFQWQSSWSANWAVRDKTTQGATRILSVYLLPTVWVPQTPLSVSPLISVTKTKGELGNGSAIADLLSSQMGGRLSYRLPAFLRHATFSLEGTRVELRDNLHLALPIGNLTDKRLAMLLSFTQDNSQGRL